MGVMKVDVIIAKLRECDTVMTEPEMNEVARKLEKNYHPGRPPAEGPNVLLEADALVSGDRADAYGDAYEAARKFCAIGQALTGLELKPEHWPLLMIALKLSRIGNAGWHRDSFVDVAGYVRVAELVNAGGN
jgi:hypothetical protein